MTGHPQARAWLREEYRTLATEMQRAWGTARAAISTGMAATGAEPGDIDGYLNETFDALFGETWKELRRKFDNEDGDPDRDMPWPLDAERAPVAPILHAAE